MRGMKRFGFFLVLMAGVATAYEVANATPADGQAVRLKTSHMAARGAQGMTWVRYEDPYERSFSLEVPRGWTVKGGLFRVGYSDVRPMVDMTSADGQTEIRLGDIAIPSYALPTPEHPPGDHVDLGAQAQMTSAQYHTGQEFSTAYAEMHFIHTCQKLVPQPTDGTPPVKDYLPDSQAQQSTAGQTTYQCESSQGERLAYAYARTNLQPNLWQVVALVSYLTPADHVAATREIVLHASQTFQISPQWMERQRQEDAAGMQYQQMRQRQRIYELGQQVQQFEQQMRAMRDQVSAFERGQARQAAQVEGFTNALNGITPTIDPYGNERDVWTGPYANYWRSGNGTIVNSTDSPGAGWTRLQQKQ
jgi:hypothetical protein